MYWVGEDSVSGMCEDVWDDEGMMYWVGEDSVNGMCEDMRDNEM